MNLRLSVTVVLDCLTMSLFSLASAISQLKLHNAFVMYPHSQDDPLPPISALALKATWIYKAVPCVWVLLAAMILLSQRKKAQPGVGIAQLYSSATLLIGLAMLLFFAVAGILPFVPIVVRMAP